MRGGLDQTTVVRSHLLSKPRAPRGFVPAGVSTIFALAVMTGAGNEFHDEIPLLYNVPAGSRRLRPASGCRLLRPASGCR